VPYAFGARRLLDAAVRKGVLVTNPIDRAEKVPSPGESDRGIALDEDELHKLLDGFKGSVLFPILAVAAFTGARRNEVLALRWSDLDTVEKTLRIERAIEKVKKQPLALNGPKREQHKRTITVDAALRPRLGPSRRGCQSVPVRTIAKCLMQLDWKGGRAV
jgi:integrase